jgi:glycosyltransferase involved in cell wall biosynthesis
MRILRIDSWDGRPGGAQEYVRTVSNELATRGHPQRIVQVVSVPRPDARVDERVVVVPARGLRRRAEDLLAAPEFERALRGEIRDFQPDVLHLHHFDALFGPLAKLLDDVDVPIVFTAHDTELVCPISTLLRPGNIVCDGGVRFRCLFTGCHVGLGGPFNLWQGRVFDRQVQPKVRAFLCPSRRLARYLFDNGYRPAIHLAPFVELPAEVPSAPYPFRSDGVPTIGFLGRLEPYKGVQLLVDAVGRLTKRVPALRLEIAGEGPYRETLEQLVNRSGLADRVRFHGDVRGAAKEDWFRGIDALVVPSTAWENFGFVAVEALARGRPVVASDFGGLPDIVDDRESGRLVPVGDPTRLADALEDLLSDRDRARRWGLEGRRRVMERFTPARHVEGLLRVYDAAIRGERLESEVGAMTGPAAVP